MKLLKVKKQDAKPSIRIKAAGNVFVEVYKDNKGYFYRIDVPGATDFVSKERFESQDKAKLAGTTHAKKFISKVKGDQKKADNSPARSSRIRTVKNSSPARSRCTWISHSEEDDMKLIKVKKADDNDPNVERVFYEKCAQQSERGAKKQNGFCEYTFSPSKWNKNDYVEVHVSMPSASGDGSGKVVSVDDAIKVTEARLATLKECKSKLKKLQDEAKSLGLKKEK